MRGGILLVLSALLANVSMLKAQAGSARPNPAEEQAIRGVYEQLLNADAAGDTATLSRILAPGYTFVPPRGDTILTREQRLAHSAADTSSNTVRYDLGVCRTQIHGTTGVAHCRYTARVRYPDAAADSVREMISTAVFVKQGKDWRLIATHPAPVRRTPASSSSQAR